MFPVPPALPFHCIHTHTHEQDSIPAYLDQYVSFVASQANHQRVSILLDTLQSLVSQGYVQPRLVCELLLKYLDLRNETVWTASLELVRNMVGGVHYKGCRDLMKLLFNKFDCLPRSIPEQQISAVLKGQEVHEQVCLCLPLYFTFHSCCTISWIAIVHFFQLILLMMRWVNQIHLNSSKKLFFLCQICRHYPEKNSSAHWVRSRWE